MSEENKEMTGYPSVDRPWLKYYSEKQEDTPLPDCSIYEFLYQCNTLYLKYTALNYFGTKITYEKMFKKIGLVSSALKNYGVKKGDIISVCALNIPEAFYLFYAINKVGAVSNWLGLTSPVEDLHEQILTTNSKLIFSVEQAMDKIIEAVKDTKAEMIITLSIDNSMPKWMKIAVKMKKKHTSNYSSNPVCVTKWKKFMSDSNERHDVLEKTENDLALIIYTGGTTGVPKGVMLSNKNINAHYINFYQANTKALTNYQRRERYLGCVPLFLAFGLIAGGNAPLCHSMELILAPDPSPKVVLKMILQTKPNHIIGGRSLVDGLGKMAEDTQIDYSYIRSVLYGGEGADENWERKVEEKLKTHNMNAPVLNGYGMTETSSGALFTRPQEPRRLFPLPNVDVKIVDPEDYHTEYSYNTEGELCISADTVMLGYFNNDVETTKVLFEEHGQKWFKTHDLAIIAPDGTITITGRLKRIYHKLTPDNVIIRVYPMRTEEVIAKDADVERCAVVGIKDEKTEYRTICYLLLRETPKHPDEAHTIRERLDGLCHEKLPESHLPDEYVFVEEFPLTRAGKVDYRELEKMAEEKKISLDEKDKEDDGDKSMHRRVDYKNNIQLSKDDEELFQKYAFLYNEPCTWTFSNESNMTDIDRINLQKYVFSIIRRTKLENTAIERLLEITMKELDHQYIRKEHIENKTGFLTALWGVLTCVTLEKGIIFNAFNSLSGIGYVQIGIRIIFFVAMIVSCVYIFATFMTGKYKRFEFEEIECNYLSAVEDKDISNVAFLEAYTNICLDNIRGEHKKLQRLKRALIWTMIYSILTLLVWII